MKKIKHVTSLPQNVYETLQRALAIYLQEFIPLFDDTKPTEYQLKLRAEINRAQEFMRDLKNENIDLYTLRRRYGDEAVSAIFTNANLPTPWKITRTNQV